MALFKGQGHHVLKAKFHIWAITYHWYLWIQMIIHTIVVYELRVCHDFDPRSYCQGHSVHKANFCVWAIITFTGNLELYYTSHNCFPGAKDCRCIVNLSP